MNNVATSDSNVNVLCQCKCVLDSGKLAPCPHPASATVTGHVGGSRVREHRVCREHQRAWREWAEEAGGAVRFVPLPVLVGAL